MKWLGGIALIAMAAHGWAEEPATLEQLAQSVKMSKQEFLDSEAQKRKILASLYKINRNVKTISKQKTVLTDELLGTKSRIQDLNHSIAKLEELTSQQKLLLKKRLRVLYKFSGQGFVKSLFSTSSNYELDRFLRFMKIVSEKDSQLIHSYQKNILAYQRQKNKLSRETERLTSLKDRIKVQEDRLNQENQNTQQLLHQVDSTRLTQLANLHSLRTKTDHLAAKSERVDVALLKMLEPSFFEQKGALSWPLSGEVAQRFGYIIEPDFQYRLSHKGWFITSQPSQAVSSCFAGVVAFAGSLEGYGQAIVIDHGHHYYTVYGYASEVHVQIGDKVTQNQKIAKTGWSPVHRQNGIYFEIRHFSEPEDPASWLKQNGMPISMNDNEPR